MRTSPRNSLTLTAFVVPTGVAVVYFVLAFGAKLRGSTWWDDHFGVGLMWVLGGLGGALLTRLVWAAFAPERHLPRWLAIVLLLLLAASAGSVWLRGAIANAMAGF